MNVSKDMARSVDIEGVEISHDGPRCSFDTMLKLFELEGDAYLARLALIVRGADTARPDLGPRGPRGCMRSHLDCRRWRVDDDMG